MKTDATATHPCVFSFPSLDTVVRVEETEGAAVILASRDTFSEARRVKFIRRLAAEGFIPDQFIWISGALTGPASPVRWLVDAASFLPWGSPGRPNSTRHAGHPWRSKRGMARRAGHAADVAPLIFGPLRGPSDRSRAALASWAELPARRAPWFHRFSSTAFALGPESTTPAK